MAPPLVFAAQMHAVSDGAGAQAGPGCQQLAPAKTAKRLRGDATIGRGVARAAGPRPTVVVAKFTARARRRLVRVRALTAELHIRITDASGNTALLKHRVALRR